MGNAKAKSKMRGKTTRILIVDDHPLVRQGLIQMLEEEPDLEVCGEADGASQALPQLEKTHPDLVIIDLSLKDGSGIELIRQIRSIDKSIRMLVVSMHDEKLYADRAISAGAMGYVNKGEASDRFIEAIRQINQGKIYLSDAMVDRMLHRRANGQDDEGSPVDRLSNRELEVFEMIGRGMSTRNIAEKLHLSVKTVETHRESIKRKLNLDANLQLIRTAVQFQLEEGS